MATQPSVEDIWRAIFSGQFPALRRGHHLRGRIPAKARCKNCKAPFDGPGAFLMRLLGRGQYHRNPRFCDFWTEFCRKHPGGADVELSLLAVDVRDSTTIAEQMNPVDFGRLMNRFFGVATDTLIRTDAFIDKVVGDGVVGLYFPGFAGPEYPSMAVMAAQDLLRAVGYGTPKGPWLPIGVGVHTGTAYVGTVSGPRGELTDLTVLGDAANVTARLASRAGPGEALLSEATYAAARLNLGDLEQRVLELKGKSETVQVRVLQARAG